MHGGRIQRPSSFALESRGEIGNRESHDGIHSDFSATYTTLDAMQYLTRAAARLFLNSSKDAFFLGLISWSQLLDRLVALRGMCSPSNPSGIAADRILRVEEWQTDDEWEYEGESPSNKRQGSDYQSSFESTLDYPSGEDEDGAFLRFIAGTNTGLSNWEFHQYDDDFFPSVPHGHWNGRHQPKLDPYQGWVYKGSKQQWREPRKNIVSLWNERQFREFALVAIDYYRTHYPNYDGWRVVNPMRLPRRR